MCHTIVIPLNTLLVVFAFRSWKWFVLARILVAIQMGLGSFFFRYFNKAGLRVLNAVNPFYIKRHEPGYEEFKWSAICEWIVVLGCVEITLITGLELRNYEKENEERSRKHVGIWTI
ncbi:prokaryotic DNA topoisomerase [Schistosoma japonicum]|nr:prokaryotic DNA topoisomerase [Schistosoma japonicum]